MGSRFPLATPPLCQLCRRAASRLIALPTNPNGNANRPYYSCKSGHKFNFITWDDDRDTSASYPYCSCGFPSRQNWTKGPNPSSWFACSSRECGFHKEIDVQNNPVELESSTPVEYNAVELESFAPIRTSSKSSISDGGKGAVIERVVEVYLWFKYSRAFVGLKKQAKLLACGMNV